VRIAAYEVPKVAGMVAGSEAKFRTKQVEQMLGVCAGI
jgi:hypothetical protein